MRSNGFASCTAAVADGRRFNLPILLHAGLAFWEKGGAHAEHTRVMRHRSIWCAGNTCDAAIATLATDHGYPLGTEWLRLPKMCGRAPSEGGRLHEPVVERIIGGELTQHQERQADIAHADVTRARVQKRPVHRNAEPHQHPG